MTWVWDVEKSVLPYDKDGSFQHLKPCLLNVLSTRNRVKMNAIASF